MLNINIHFRSLACCHSVDVFIYLFIFYSLFSNTLLILSLLLLYTTVSEVQSTNSYKQIPALNSVIRSACVCVCVYVYFEECISESTARWYV